MAKPVDYKTLKEMLKLLFEDNDKIHNDLHPWLEKVGEHIKDLDAQAVGWPAVEDAIRGVLAQMQHVLAAHIDRTTTDLCKGSVR